MQTETELSTSPFEQSVNHPGPPGVWRWLIPVLIAVLGSVWILAGLDHGMLWQDEAQTALISQTVLQHGVPLGTDGRNFFSQEQGAEYGPHYLWRWHTWLMFYLVAGSFKLLGAGTFSARLPFALFGVATVVLAYFAGTELWRDWRAGLAAALLVLACVPALLLFRQCRYYSLCMFFSLLGLHAYVQLVRGRRWAWLTLSAAAILLFHSHYIYCATLIAAIGLHALIWHRRHWRMLLLCLAIVVVVCGPWAVWLSHANYSQRYDRSLLNFGATAAQGRDYVLELLRYDFPWCLLLVPAVWTLKRGWTHWADRIDLAALPILFTVINVVVLAATGPASFSRYLAPVIVPMLLVGGQLVVLAFDTGIWIGLPLVAVLALWWPLVSYGYEITHPLVGPIEGLVSFFKANAGPNDTVVMTYGDLPVAFYTGLRVVGPYSGEEFSQAAAARWVVPRHFMVASTELPLRKYLMHDLDMRRYRSFTLSAPDTEFENREDLAEHRFWSAGPQVPRVLVLERMGDERDGDSTGSKERRSTSLGATRFDDNEAATKR